MFLEVSVYHPPAPTPRPVLLATDAWMFPSPGRGGSAGQSITPWASQTPPSPASIRGRSPSPAHVPRSEERAEVTPSQVYAFPVTEQSNHMDDKTFNSGSCPRDPLVGASPSKSRLWHDSVIHAKDSYHMFTEKTLTTPNHNQTGNLFIVSTY